MYNNVFFNGNEFKNKKSLPSLILYISFEIRVLYKRSLWVIKN